MEQGPILTHRFLSRLGATGHVLHWVLVPSWYVIPVHSTHSVFRALSSLPAGHTCGSQEEQYALDCHPWYWTGGVTRTCPFTQCMA
jgi:hypothetical protein